MGRRPWSTRLTVEECKCLNVSRLTPATKIGMELRRLVFIPPGDPANNVIEYTSTKCHFGGERFWFICPACGKKFLKLFLPPHGGGYYACRKCHNLTYESCKEHDKRIDEILKNPKAAAERMKKGSLKDAFLVLSACKMFLRKRERRMRRYLNQ